jgi:hypothetical protein
MEDSFIAVEAHVKVSAIGKTYAEAKGIGFELYVGGDYLLCRSVLQEGFKARSLLVDEAEQEFLAPAGRHYCNY